MNEFRIIKYKVEDKEIDVKIDNETNSVWLTMSDIVVLYNRNKSGISRHIKNIVKNQEDLSCKKRNSGSNFLFKKTIFVNGQTRNITYYNLDVAIEIGYKTGSKNGLLLKEYIDNYLKKQNLINHIYNSKRIKFDNENVSLDVTVVPEEDTVYLNKEQLMLLFDTSRQNLEYHIENIYESKELDKSATCKEILQVQLEGDRKISRYISYYNLDMIISIGFRINTKQGIIFRKWANRELKNLLINGYTINDERIISINQNYVNLVNRVDKLENRINKVEENEKHYLITDKLIFEGNVFDAITLISSILETANKTIFLIDPYIDIKSLNALKNKKKEVDLVLITSRNTRISKEDLNTFNEEYNGLSIKYDDSYHDRYLIIDNEVFYHLGSSINYLGKRFSQITKIIDIDIIDTLKMRVKKFICQYSD